MSEQQEYFNHSITNTYETKLKARSFSADNSSTKETSDAVKAATTETGAAATGAATGAGVAAGIATTSVVGVVVTSVILVAGPSINNLPKLANVEATISANALSYSFNVSYVKAGSLEVKIENIDDTRSNSYDLLDSTPIVAHTRKVPQREDSSSSNDSSSASSSSSVSSSEDVSSSSGVTDSSSAASSSTSQFQVGIEGIFENLLLNHSYVFMVTAPINDDLRQTLYSATLVTGTEAKDVAPSLTVGTPVVDYDKVKLNVPVDVSDPSHHWSEGSLFAVLIGRTVPKDGLTTTTPPLGTDGDVITADTSGSDIAILTRTVHLATPYASSTQTFDLTNYIKGYLIRLQIYGGAETNWKMLYETGLYY
jgi:hypothetical protein